MSDTSQTRRSIGRRVQDFNDYLFIDFLGGPKLVKISWVVNTQKLIMPFFVLALMYWYQNFAMSTWVFFGLTTVYCFNWVVMKHLVFPDPAWETKITFGGVVMLSVVAWTGPYWITPFLVISNYLGPRPEPSGPFLALIIAMQTIGIVTMMVSDAQKFYTLRIKKGLITDGYFKYTRNPNYLGDMLAYGSWALFSRHWLPCVLLCSLWLCGFLPRMLVKDESIARHPGWPAYKEHSSLLLPWPLFLALFGRGRQTRPIPRE